MAKSEKKFSVVKDPTSDYVACKKEIMRLRFAKALGDTAINVSEFNRLRKFSARCLTIKNSNRGN